MIEFEIKLQAVHEDVKAILVKLGAEYLETEYNNDLYFNHPSRDFHVSDEALRIREDNNGWKLTYKGPKIDDKTKSREEIEIVLNSKYIQDILLKLNFTFSGEVRKTREIWKFEQTTIFLDSIDSLGEFIEFEIIGFEEEKQEIVEKLYTVVKKMGFDPDDQIRTSYLELVMGSKNN